MNSSAIDTFAVTTILAGAFAFYSIRLAYQSWSFNDISTGNDATPLWIPQITMALGTAVFFIAFVDELVLEWRGARREAVAPSELTRHE
jgi:TRAP-type C4-dicarboxylate transport system permease small subunit